MTLRGSRLQQQTREDAYFQSLDRAGDHVCVPWTGIDAAGVYICPGFEYRASVGLIAWIVPLLIYDQGLVPGFQIDGIPTAALAQPRRADRGTAQPLRPVTPTKAGTLPEGAVESQYMHLLKTYLRQVKIAGPETETKFLPYPADYHVVVHGPYRQVQVGHLLARPDGTGANFLVPDGNDPVKAQQLIEQSRVGMPAPTAAGVPPYETDRLPATAGARIRLEAERLLAGNSTIRRAGVQKSGKTSHRNLEAGELVVLEPGSLPNLAMPTKTLVQKVNAQDPKWSQK